MVPWMRGKTCLVTGANSGIGLETARGLAQRGARVVLLCRDEARGRAALEQLRSATDSAALELVRLDLASLTSVRQAAEQVLERCPEIHVLVNNAGLVLGERTETLDGFESTFAINHLGPFLLTRLLLERLRRSAPARVIMVSSEAHRIGHLGWGDLMSRRAYVGLWVYGKSKLCNLLMTASLARRLEGSGVTANALHPGVVASGFARDGDLGGLQERIAGWLAPLMASPARGATASLHLATAPEVASVTGGYFIGRRPRRPSRAAREPARAEWLWAESERLLAPWL